MADRIAVVSVRGGGVDSCEGQVIARCCRGGVCADVPVDRGLEPGEYEVDDPRVSPCVEVIEGLRERGIKAAYVCHSKESERCLARLAALLALRFRGALLLVGYSGAVAGALAKMFPQIYLCDPQGPTSAYDWVGPERLKEVLGRVEAVVVSPGSLARVEVRELVEAARRHGKPVVAFGASMAYLKELGVEHFCPYGRRE